ncbi:MAG: PEP-CTERM sorting domain-containing protein [Planctomycetota bacterium]
MNRTLATAVFVGATLSSTAALAVVSEPSAAGAANLHALGWQTFDNAGSDNNSGIADATPDNNSTFDPTPTGSHAPVAGGGVYLKGAIGAGSSILGWDGYGQSTNNSFLQGPTFGSSMIGSAPFGLNIEDVPMADGSPGTRLNTQGAAASSWKFRTNGSQELGDFSITNHSDFVFRLERVHYDARVGNANSPDRLELVYLAGDPGGGFDANLTRADDGTEVVDGRVFSDISFADSPSTQNVSVSLAAGLFPPTAVRLAPGDSASFRLRWSDSASDFAESQIDNLALSGTFLDPNNGFAEIDPTAAGAVGPGPGDFNSDGRVDNADLNLLLNNWGQAEVPAEWSAPLTPPVNNDELNSLLNNWGSGTAVPEPAAMALTLTSAAAFSQTRRRRE